MPQSIQGNVDLARKRLSKVYENREELVKDSVVRQAMDKCFDGIGGPEGFGTFVAETINKAGNSNNVTQRQKLITAMRDWFRDYDEITQKSLDLSAVSDEDLQYIIVGSVMERVKSDMEFGMAIVMDVIRQIQANNPDQLDAVVDAICAIRDGEIDLGLLEHQAAEQEPVENEEP